MLGELPKHSLLRRQFRRHFGGLEDLPESWRQFLVDIDAAYQEFDNDRAMLERSLDLSSQELLQANAEMVAVFRALPDLLFRVDATGRILSAQTGSRSDPLMARQGSVLGQRLEDTVLRSAGPDVRERLQQNLNEKRFATLEFPLADPTAGTRLDYEIRLVPVRGDETLIIVRNITERKQAEEALRQMVSLQQSIFESTADGILVVNRQRRVVSFNSRLTAMWRLTAAELSGGDDRDLATRFAGQLHDGERYLAGLEEVYADAEREVRDTLRFRDGRIYERYSCAQRLEGRPVGRVWSFRDITERERAVEALQAEQSRFRLVALATRDAIYDWNLVTGEVWRSETFQMLYGGDRKVPADRLLWEDFVHPDDLKRVKQSMADAICSQKQQWSQEYRLVRADGGSAHVIDRGYIHYDAAGRMVRMIGAMTDISEHKRLEEQFLQSQKMEAIGQLAGGVAHDFNNLLTVILGNLSFLRACGMANAEVLASIDECEKASRRAANLTRQLLTFSRRERVELRPLNLNEVVAEITKMLRRLVGEHIQVQTSFAPGDMPVQGDAGNLEQLLMNLVVNARDAMPGGGRVLIETAEAVFDERSVQLHPSRRAGRFVCLRVADTGCGIPAELLPRVFEPFFTTKDPGKGTGLGLATVFGIVQQHCGWIEVESTVNRGTVLQVFLPWQQGVAADGAAGPPPVFSVGGTETVLLAEDEESVRRWMQLLLQRHGYRVFAVGSGLAAMEFVLTRREKIDLLVTDMVMPGGISGRALGEQLQKVQPGVRVLYCSGYTDEFLGAEAYIRQSVSFLAKPFDAAKFLERIRERLDTR